MLIPIRGSPAGNLQYMFVNKRYNKCRPSKDELTAETLSESHVQDVSNPGSPAASLTPRLDCSSAL